MAFLVIATSVAASPRATLAQQRGPLGFYSHRRTSVSRRSIMEAEAVVFERLSAIGCSIFAWPAGTAQSPDHRPPARRHPMNQSGFQGSDALA